ncbi:MAG: AAA family ATPase [Muribaculaceae bacterium]|nr:AAA family ATPase [Muribaculaceae bacterium]
MIDTKTDIPRANDQKSDGFFADVLRSLPYTPNEEQTRVIAALAHFILYSDENSVFLLNGYAGTGKTSLTGAVVKALSLQGIKTVLLAPTGRAAMIFSDYAGHPASTIHRKIYRQDSFMSDGFSLAENKHTHTLFIVDEASMIANVNNADGSAAFGSGRLLDDLMSYVYNGAGCRLIMMGDGAQLPPVGQAVSPALSEQVLQSYRMTVYSLQLTTIARQAAESGILYNATLLRKAMTDADADTIAPPELQLDGFADIRRITGEFLLEEIDSCYSRDGIDDTIIITRSNRRATQFNMGVRNQILYREDEITSGGLLVVGKNNYFWAKDEKGIDFIANGDILQVKRVWGQIEELYGLRFAGVTVSLPDHDNIELDVKIILDSLMSDTPSLSRQQSERLFNEALADQEGDKRSRLRSLKQDPYFNALQVKWAYAVTCHKAQGGQWQNVFVDMGAIAPEALTTLDFHRWLYTAITRARRRVYLVNSPI